MAKITLNEVVGKYNEARSPKKGKASRKLDFTKSGEGLEVKTMDLRKCKECDDESCSACKDE